LSISVTLNDLERL